MRSEEFVIRRRRPRATPMRSRRFGATAMGAAAAGAAPVEFPGIDFADQDTTKGRWFGFGLAALIHGGLLAFLVVLAAMNPEIAENIIELQLMKEPPAERTDPAPARRVVAERRSANYAPQAQAMKADVANPKVVARRSAISSDALKVDAVGARVAPRQVSRSRIATQRVNAVATIAETHRASIDVSDDELWAALYTAPEAISAEFRATRKYGVHTLDEKAIIEGSPEDGVRGEDARACGGRCKRAGCTFVSTARKLMRAVVSVRQHVASSQPPQLSQPR